MTDSLDGKVAVITGGSRGIGRAVAGELAQRGADLMLIARTAEHLKAAAERITQDTGRRVMTAATDLRTADGVESAAQAVREGFGRTDILVNNAGATQGGDFLDLDDAVWEDGFALKFYAAVRMSRALWPLLTEAHGAVVNISGGFADVPDPNFMIGGAVNAAMTNFSKALAGRGLKDDVNVNCIHPGPVKTNRWKELVATRAELEKISVDEVARKIVASSGVRAFAEPEDVARLIAFLVSTGSRQVHGAVIRMDGGGNKAL